MIEIGVMWFPRKRETFTKMEASIGAPFTVYPDGKEFKHQTSAPVKYLGDHAGCFKHYYRVLEDLCKSDAEYVAVLSDDILFKEDWVNVAISGLKKDVSFVACYVPNELKRRFKWGDGWHEVKGGWDKTYGGGYVFRRETALKMLEHPFMINHRDNYKANQQIDHCIPEVAHRMGLKQMFYLPSLIKHIGYTSTLGHSHTHRENVGW
jgi:hypothetical protein